MADDHDEDITENDELAKIAEDLEIDMDNVYHLMLVGGIEMMGEIFQLEPEENPDMSEEDVKVQHAFAQDYLFLNPIKVFRDSWIDADGYSCQNYFIEWNPCIDGPYTYINPTNVMSMSKPNEESLTAYLHAVKDQYYPNSDIETIPTDKVIVESQVSNIIDFKAYKDKQSNIH